MFEADAGIIGLNALTLKNYKECIKKWLDQYNKGMDPTFHKFRHLGVLVKCAFQTLKTQLL